jgi:hypothetical protein
VNDSATLTGDNVASATGTVTYNVYSNATCTNQVGTANTESITTAGTVPSSSPITLNTPGTYYWQATYSGDGLNGTSASACGAEVETVTSASPCAANLTPYLLNATFKNGSFTGEFCVNSKGFGTYTQGTVSGSGSVNVVHGTTVISAYGKNLALLGAIAGTHSLFFELLPSPIKSGTFTLTANKW